MSDATPVTTASASPARTHTEVAVGVLLRESDGALLITSRPAGKPYAGFWEFPGGKLYCRLIEGRYPNYNSVIPTVNTNCATIDRKSLLGAIKRVLPFASESSSLVRFHVEEGSLLVSAEDVDFATSAKETLTCEYTGVKMDIGFNGSTIYDMLKAIDRSMNLQHVMLLEKHGGRSGSWQRSTLAQTPTK